MVKELKTNNMGYKPFKMLGHELPGIKQRGMPMRSFDASGGAINEEMVEKVDKNPGSGINYGAAVGSSPAKGWFSNIVKKVTGGAKKLAGAATGALGLGKNDAPAEGGGDGGAVPPHGDEAHTGGAIGGGAGAAPEEAPFEAMERSKFMSMDKGARKEYMGGLDQDQRKEQMSSMFSGFGGVGGINKSGMGLFSDIRLKENIKRTGVSSSGIPIYEFNYIGNSARYSGAMAQDLLGTDSVVMHDSGFYMVNYDSIDVDMELV